MTTFEWIVIILLVLIIIDIDKLRKIIWKEFIGKHLDENNE